MSLIDLIVLFLIFVKDVEFPRWSIMLYLFIYLSVIASALYSFLRLSCRNFLFRHFTVQLCSILGLRDPCGVTHAVTPTVNPALPTLPYTATSPRRRRYIPPRRHPHPCCRHLPRSRLHSRRHLPRNLQISGLPPPPTNLRDPPPPRNHEEGRGRGHHCHCPSSR